MARPQLNRPVIRPACAAEFPAASRVIMQSIKYSHAGFIDNKYLDGLKEDNWAGFLAKAEGGFTCFVALLGADIVGTAVMRSRAVPGRPDCGELSALYVASERIGTGIGSALLSHVLDTMRQFRLTECVLNVLKDNRRAIEFYSRRGFVMLNVEYFKKIGNGYYPMKYMRRIL